MPDNEFEKASQEKPVGIVREFLQFLAANKKWWLLPIVLILVVCCLLALDDLEAANICDTVAILKDGELVEFDQPQKLINSLPSQGRIARLRIPELTQDLLDQMEKFPEVAIAIRAGNDMVEILMPNFDKNLPELIRKAY